MQALIIAIVAGQNRPTYAGRACGLLVAASAVIVLASGAGSLAGLARPTSSPAAARVAAPPLAVR